MIMLFVPMAHAVTMSQLTMRRRVNLARVINGVGVLAENEKLNESARARACYLDRWQIWSHDGWTEAIGAVGYRYDMVGENIAGNMKSGKMAFDGLMKSPGHRANILRKEFTELGIGICGHTWVQHFGRPGPNYLDPPKEHAVMGVGI